MSDNIIGIMWNRNEGDILHEIIENALTKVDALLVADDGSTDNSLDIIKGFGSKLELIVDRSVVGKNQPHLWARQYLLNEVKKRFNPNDTWVQVIESDMMLLDTDIRTALVRYARSNVAMFWHSLDACRRDWTGEDKYPNWDRPIKEIMPDCHWVEYMLYTFRPLDGIEFSYEAKPWPRGFGKYDIKDYRKKHTDSPLLAHYGYRGPTHYMRKFKHMGATHTKYLDHRVDSVENVLKTVPRFNGLWNNNPNDTIELSRKGWIEWLTGKSI